MPWAVCLPQAYPLSDGFWIGFRSAHITEMCGIHSGLFGMQNRTFGPYLAAMPRILMSLEGRVGSALLFTVPNCKDALVEVRRLRSDVDPGPQRSSG
jgi:hypothetical protein